MPITSSMQRDGFNVLNNTTDPQTSYPSFLVSRLHVIRLRPILLFGLKKRKEKSAAERNINVVSLRVPVRSPANPVCLGGSLAKDRLPVCLFRPHLSTRRRRRRRLITRGRRRRVVARRWRRGRISSGRRGRGTSVLLDQSADVVQTGRSAGGSTRGSTVRDARRRTHTRRSPHARRRTIASIARISRVAVSCPRSLVRGLGLLLVLLLPGRSTASWAIAIASAATIRVIAVLVTAAVAVSCPRRRRRSTIVRLLVAVSPRSRISGRTALPGLLAFSAVGAVAGASLDASRGSRASTKFLHELLHNCQY